MKIALLLIMTVSLTSCFEKQPDQDTWDKIDKAIKELEPIDENQNPPIISYEIGHLKFVFSNLTDPFDLGLYQKLEIFKAGKLLNSIQSNVIELEATKFGYNTRSMFPETDRTLYVVECNDRPEPAFFKIFEFKNDSIRQIGDTESLTAEYFGDIDGDGRLEIGGFNAHCEGSAVDDFKDPNFCMEHFRIYEISDSIIRDTITEKEKITHVQQK